MPRDSTVRIWDAGTGVLVHCFGPGDDALGIPGHRCEPAPEIAVRRQRPAADMFPTAVQERGLRRRPPELRPVRVHVRWWTSPGATDPRLKV